MPVPFGQLYSRALRYIGKIDPITGRRLSFDESLFCADLMLDEGPTPDEVAVMERELAEEEAARRHRDDPGFDAESPF